MVRLVFLHLVCGLCACATAPIERVSPEEVLGQAPPRRPHEPVASAALLARLQRFVDDGERSRAATPKGAPMPRAWADEWLRALDDVDQLTTSKTATTLDVVRARLWLQTALEADGSRFGDVPGDVLVRVQRALASLTTRLISLSPRGGKHARANPATFDWPLEPVVVTSGWGDRLHPVHGEYRFHAGVDLEATTAQPIYAPAPGVVAFAGWNAGHGKQVELQHDPHVSTRFSHLSAWAVQPGDLVKRGDLIGWAGKTGTATGVHLHFELRRDGESVDPEVELPGPGGLMVNR